MLFTRMEIEKSLTQARLAGITFDLQNDYE